MFSEPRGAHVQLSNGATGTTPAHFVIQREGDFTVTISKEGHETVVIPIRSSKKINRAAMALLLPANGLLGLPFGLAVLASGEDFVATHRPNPVKMKLKPLAPAAHGSASPVGGINPRLTLDVEAPPRSS